MDVSEDKTHPTSQQTATILVYLTLINSRLIRNFHRFLISILLQRYIGDEAVVPGLMKERARHSLVDEHQSKPCFGR